MGDARRGEARGAGENPGRGGRHRGRRYGARAHGGSRQREWVEIPTRTRPRAVLVDPRVHAHDWNMLNNRKRLGFAPSMLIAPVPGSEIYFHPYFSTRSRRDHLTVAFSPPSGTTTPVG